MAKTAKLKEGWGRRGKVKLIHRGSSTQNGMQGWKCVVRSKARGGEQGGA